MPEIDNSTSGIVWQWLNEHKQDVLDYFASIMREASDIQLVNFDTDRHAGLLASYIYQGIRRIDNVKPSTLVEGLTQLGAEIRQRLETIAAEAERQGAYAEEQGDRVDGALSDYTTLHATVQQQGNTAEQQGAAAQTIADTVNRWYNGTNNNGIKHDVEDFYAQAQAFDTAVRQSWASFYTNGAVPDWTAFWAEVLDNWQAWTAEEASRKGILCLDFDYDFEEGELIMDYVERDTLSRDMFDFQDGDLIIDYNN